MFTHLKETRETIWKLPASDWLCYARQRMTDFELHCPVRHRGRKSKRTADNNRVVSSWIIYNELLCGNRMHVSLVMRASLAPRLRDRNLFSNLTVKLFDQLATKAYTIVRKILLSIFPSARFHWANFLRNSKIYTILMVMVKTKLGVCCLRSYTLPLQYISPLGILASALLIMLQRFWMICLMMYVQSLLSTHSERSSKPISLQKHIHPNFCFSQSFSMLLTPAMSQVDDKSFLLFLYGAPRVCLLIGIKCYENATRIRITFGEEGSWLLP